MKKLLIILLLSVLWIPKTRASQGEWGFYAHRLINRMAVFLLPPEMFGFYKEHADYLAERAVAPDERRYAVDWEAPRHYIDIDVYGDSAIHRMPRRWKDAVEKYSEDTLMAYGTAPWNVFWMKKRLTRAMQAQDWAKVLQLSAEIGHYVGDIHVPLHTTENYNGQLSGQYGIHGFWESRLPELFSQNYDFFLQNAQYLEAPQEVAWQAVIDSHDCLEEVLGLEKALTQKHGDHEKFSYESRNGRNVKVYAYSFSEAYHQALKGQVEARMRKAIQCTADFWYTCWVDAGQPVLNSKGNPQALERLRALERQEREKWKGVNIKGRKHEH